MFVKSLAKAFGLPPKTVGAHRRPLPERGREREREGGENREDCGYLIQCRSHDPEKAGGRSTRGMIFVIAVILAVFVVPAPWGLVLVGVAAVIEIGETFFWIWLSQRHRVKMGAETMLGARAEVASACRPEGQVRIQGELWRARCEAGADQGAWVRVVERDGLTLLVEPE